MTSEETLLHAVYDTPDDDGPRLVLADWLITQNNPRGEHIALQVRGLKTGSRDFLAKAFALQRSFGSAWSGPFESPGFARGFPSELRLTQAQMASLRASVLSPEWSTIEQIDFQLPDGTQEPALRVRSEDANLLFEDLLAIGQPRALKRLVRVPAQPLLTLSQHPLAKRIEQVSSFEQVDEAVVASFARDALFPKLTQLHLVQPSPEWAVRLMTSRPYGWRLLSFSFEGFTLTRREPDHLFGQLTDPEPPERLFDLLAAFARLGLSWATFTEAARVSQGARSRIIGALGLSEDKVQFSTPSG